MKRFVSVLLVIVILMSVLTLTSCEKTEVIVALSKIFKFLKPLINDHVHTVDVIPSFESTCLEHGYTEGKYCLTCGEILIEPRKLPLVPHTMSVIPAIESTCSENGKSEGRYCTCCEKVIIPQTDIPLKTHIYDGDYDANCNECGYHRDIMCPHNNKDVLSAKESSCFEIGLTEGKKCSDCGEILIAQETIPLKEHQKSGWIIDVAATPTEDGLKHIECIICSEFLEQKAILAYSDGIEYMLNDDGKSYIVVGEGTCTDPHLVIPETYNGLPVTRIKDTAFTHCSFVLSAIIPDSVTEIGDLFMRCSNLKSVTLPKSIARIKGPMIFAGSPITSIYYEGTLEDWLKIEFVNSSPPVYGKDLYFAGELVTDIVIPDYITNIPDGMFSGCSSIENVYIGKSVSYIGYSFNECISVSNIMVSEDNQYYKSIDGNLYSKDGKTLIQYAIGKTDQSFTIPNSVEYIKKCAFESCNHLTSLIIPDSVFDISDRVFIGCDSLTIYCEAETKPDEWGTDWNGKCPVVWGYKPE